MMKYEDALKEWGARMLEGSRSPWGGRETVPVKVDRSTVLVLMDFKEGFACCGGADPDCYCSFAESPTAKVEISGMVIEGPKIDVGHTITYSIDASDFDFVAVLGAIVEAGGGNVTS